MAIENMNRDDSLQRVRDLTTAWDVIVIGGGATGIGIALDAATRHLNVLLLEQSDFGKGTSSRSTKLIHGGVRYLQQGNLKLVRDALQERSRLLNNAPHLVRSLSFVIPCHSLWERFFYGTGLKLYDALALGDRFASSGWVGRSQLAQRMPGLKQLSLAGAVVYHDGQFDDARLLLSMARTAWDNGAALLNYATVKGFIKNQSGEICGVTFVDGESGEQFEVRSQCVINATGPFTDAVTALDDERREPMIAPSQGVHLVVPSSFFPGQTALIVPKTADGRVIFLIPWHDHVLIGTTDTAIPAAVLEPRAREEEIQFLLETSADYLAQPLSREDVLSVYTGIRPLVKNSKTGRTAALSRDHVIRVSSSGLITIAGGKWTTVRKMAEGCLDVAIKNAKLAAGNCSTKSLKLHGYLEGVDFSSPRAVYGSDLPQIEQLERSHPEWSQPFSPDLSVTPSEVRWAVRHEMARTIEDVLARRSRSLFLNAIATRDIAPEVAQVMAEELNQNQSWIDKQLSEFQRLLEGYLP